MPQKENSNIPAGMEAVHHQFERWRKTRRGRAQIPERLWDAAASLAREYGVNQTSRALRLNFNKLKTFVNPAKRGRRTMPAPQFLEVPASPLTGVAECVIELEGRRGRMRVEWKGSPAPDLAGLSRIVWERK